MANAGNLVFEMSANVARLQQDMERAKGVVDQAMTGMSRAASVAKTALAGVAVGALVAKTVSEVQRLVGEMDKLDDVAQKTGASVEELSKLQQIARINGTAFEAVEGAMVKFIKTINTVGDESGDASRALRSVGLNIDDLKGKDPAANFQIVARALNEYKDSASKTAVALALFGKSGAEMLPMLKDAAEFGDVVAKVTAQQAAEAANLHDEQRRLKLVMDQTSQTLLASAVPAMTEWITAVRAAYEEGGKLMAVIAGIGGAFALGGDLLTGGDKGRLKSLQAEINRERAILQDMSRTDVTHAYKASQALAREKQQKRVNALLAEEVALSSKIAAAGGFEDQVMGKASGKRPLDFQLGEKKPAEKKSGESPYDQELKKLMDAVAKAQELTEVERILADVQRNRFGVLSEGQKNQLLSAAAIVDLSKEDARVRKEAEDAVKAQAQASAAAALAEANRLNQLRDQIQNLADPTRAAALAWGDYNKLLERGLVTVREINAATGDPRLQKLLNPDPTDWEVLNKALKEGDIAMGKYLEVVKRLKQDSKKTDDIWKDLGLTFESAFEKAVTGGQKMRDILAGVAQDIAKIVLRKSVTEPLSNMVTGFVKSIDWGSIFSPRAEGGSFYAGQPLLVGERGPELMVPSAAGHVVSNADMRNMGGGGAVASVNIVQNIHVDSRSDMASVYDAMRRAKDAAVQEVAALVQRGGSYAVAVRGR